MIPVTPHLANECLVDLNHTQSIHWPEVNEKYLIKEEFKIVIQINGKKRALLTTGSEIKEEDLVEKVIKLKEIQNFIKDKNILKHIYIKNKLINLIIK